MTEQVIIEVVSCEREFISLEAEWNKLLECSSSNSIFLTWEWISTWWQYFQKGLTLYIVTAREAGTSILVGLAPLVVEEKSFFKIPYCKIFLFAGSGPAAGDHMDFIIQKDYEQIVAPIFVSKIISGCSGLLPIIKLDGLSDSSYSAALFVQRFGEGKCYIHKSICPYISLPDDWNSYLEGRDTKAFRNIRRLERKFGKESSGQVYYHRIVHKDDLRNEMKSMYKLNVLSRMEHGELSSYSDIRMQRFHSDIAERFLKNDWLRLFFLNVEGIDIAVIYCFLRNRILYSYSMGFDAKWKKYGPGKLVLKYALQECIPEGIHEFDFLRGDHGYKHEWTDNTRSVLFFRASTTFIGRLFIKMYGFARIMRNKLKKSSAS
ncbi:MAG: GNAT family N-acetyltransferase [Candidatus Theseobacter exili]|nr:GNAT family N-acetyltransferase [Candidatus Theseobacter exili]